MLLILSSEGDRSTFDIVDWLLFYEEPYLLLNSANIRLKEIQIPENYIVLEVNENNSDNVFEINTKHLTAFWYRRGQIHLDHMLESYKAPIVKRLNDYLSDQLFTLEQYLYSSFEKLHGFGKFSENFANKLFHLLKAYESGFKIPKTHIVSQPLKVKTNEYITKPISHGTFRYNKKSFGAPTVDIDSEKLYDIDEFFPSLIQEKIEKKYELRIFHLEKVNYAAAIFSQRNKTTQTDYRNYDKRNPNRLVPYKIKPELEKMIDNFMNRINMKSGSIDFIVDNNHNLYFLEVNPIGQFGMISKTCNYNIEKHITNYLINRAHEE